MPTTVSYYLDINADDGYVWVNSAPYTSGGSFGIHGEFDNYRGYMGNWNYYGDLRRYNNYLRFTGLTIPSDANITSAKLTFHSQNPAFGARSNNTCTVTIWANHEDNPVSPVDANSFWALTKTTTKATWSDLGNWDVDDVEHDSPDLTAILNELFLAHGINSSIQFIIWNGEDGNGSSDSAVRCFHSAKYDPAEDHVKLTVTYTSSIPILTLVNPVMYSPVIVQLKGQINNADLVTTIERGFDWGTTISYGQSWTETGETAAIQNWSHQVNISSPSTIHFRAKCQTTSGWYYGVDQTLTNEAHETRLLNVDVTTTGYTPVPDDGQFYNKTTTEDLDTYICRGYPLDDLVYAEFGLDNFVNYYDTISYVVFKIIHGSQGAGGQYYLRLKSLSTGTEYAIVNYSNDGDPTTYEYNSYTDPATGLPWTVAGLNNYTVLIALRSGYVLGLSKLYYWEARAVYSLDARTDNKRVGTIRHVYRSGSYRAELTFGGFEIQTQLPEDYKEINLDQEIIKKLETYGLSAHDIAIRDKLSVNAIGLTRNQPLSANAIGMKRNSFKSNTLNLPKQTGGELTDAFVDDLLK